MDHNVQEMKKIVRKVRSCNVTYVCDVISMFFFGESKFIRNELQYTREMGYELHTAAFFGKGTVY